MCIQSYQAVIARLIFIISITLLSASCDDSQPDTLNGLNQNDFNYDNLLDNDFMLSSGETDNPIKRNVVYDKRIDRLDEYKVSWTYHALKAQRNLDLYAPFSRTTFLGTHNSYFSDGYWEEDPAFMMPNQHYTMAEQLEMGVRALELDIWTITLWPLWWMKKCVVTHANSTGLAELNYGLLPTRSLKASLNEIYDEFYSKPENYNEILVIYFWLGNKSKDAQKKARQKLRDSRLYPLIFRPVDTNNSIDFIHNNDGIPYPLDFYTKARILETGKRVILVTKIKEKDFNSKTEILFEDVFKSMSNKDYGFQQYGINEFTMFPAVRKGSLANQDDNGEIDGYTFREKAPQELIDHYVSKYDTLSTDYDQTLDTEKMDYQVYTKEYPVKDEDGNEITDEDGNVITEEGQVLAVRSPVIEYNEDYLSDYAPEHCNCGENALLENDLSPEIYDNYMVRMTEDRSESSRLASYYKDYGMIWSRHIRDMLKCGANIIALDKIRPDHDNHDESGDHDGLNVSDRLTAFVWSWDESEPVETAGNDYAMHNEKGRLVAKTQEEQYLFACKKTTSEANTITEEWALTAVAGNFDIGMGSCRMLGATYKFSAPYNAKDNEALKKAKVAYKMTNNISGDLKVWVNYSREDDGKTWLPREEYNKTNQALGGVYKMKKLINDGGSYDDITNFVYSDKKDDYPKIGEKIIDFQLANEGGGILEVYWYDISDSAFRMIQPPSVKIDPETKSSFALSFNPDTVGVHSATVTLFTNSAENPIYEFTVTGTALEAPEAWSLTHPLQPTELMAEINSEGYVDLTWTDESSIETGYYIYRRYDYETEYTLIGTSEENSVSFTDIEYNNMGNETHYRIAAFNDEGRSLYRWTKINNDYLPRYDDEQTIWGNIYWCN